MQLRLKGQESSFGIKLYKVSPLLRSTLEIQRGKVYEGWLGLERTVGGVECLQKSSVD